MVRHASRGKRHMGHGLYRLVRRSISHAVLALPFRMI